MDVSCQHSNKVWQTLPTTHLHCFLGLRMGTVQEDLECMRVVCTRKRSLQRIEVSREMCMVSLFRNTTVHASPQGHTVCPSLLLWDELLNNSTVCTLTQGSSRHSRPAQTGGREGSRHQCQTCPFLPRKTWLQHLNSLTHEDRSEPPPYTLLIVTAHHRPS